ncbi:hypothetical protein [Streptococcus sanguinis]|uniref:hypothetical protein n=1 Tax=Streptococcus sanguinis TaxID=1305 RepID=UPI0022845DE6|nr:hypothetical protein [Streptococcus sanguinis]MCY7020128.1 hypothetical protein [Streptococcus sanguinis]
MTNLIKIDFTPVSDYMIEMDVDDDLLDQFEFLALNDDYNLDDFTEDSFFEWIEEYFNNDYLNEIDTFINDYSLPLGLSLYLALYKIICENRNTLYSFLDNGDGLFDRITGSSYSIKNLGIEDININQSFKINDSTFLIKKIESVELNDIGKFNQLYNFIEVNIDSIVRQIQLLSVLTNFEDILELDDYIFIYSKPENELTHEDLISKLKLYSIIVNGKTLHNPVTVSNIIYPNLNISFENNSVQYRQFDEIATLLSQFNSEERLLSKFLILYQILENFEIKHDVVEEMSRGGQFKVRDFTKLVNSSQLNEEKYLKKLLTKLLNLNILEIGRTDSILNLINETWVTNISGNVDFTNLDIQLKQIGYDKVDIASFDRQVRNLNKDDILIFFTKSIYKTRCSIVHYKTHEFHLNDVTLDGMYEFKRFLEVFLVPLVLKIISTSIFSTNSPIVYRDNKLTLF